MLLGFCWLSSKRPAGGPRQGCAKRKVMSQFWYMWHKTHGQLHVFFMLLCLSLYIYIFICVCFSGKAESQYWPLGAISRVALMAIKGWSSAHLASFTCFAAAPAWLCVFMCLLRP